MKKILVIIFCLLLPVSVVLAQASDSLLIADFEDQAAGLGSWTANLGDAFVESRWGEDPGGFDCNANWCRIRMSMTSIGYCKKSLAFT